MKSQLVSSHSDFFLREEVKRDLIRLLVIDKNILLKSPKYLADLFVAYSMQDVAELEKRIKVNSGALGIDIGDLRTIFRLGGYFLEAFFPENEAKNDNGKNIAEDLISIGVCKQESFDVLTAWLDELKKYADANSSISRENRFQEYSRAGAPHFESIVSVIDFRPVFDVDYDDTSTEIESYKPKCIGVVPVAQITLKVDEGVVRQFSFQANAQALDKLIKYLQVTKKDMAIGNDYLGLNKDGLRK